MNKPILRLLSGLFGTLLLTAAAFAQPIPAFLQDYTPLRCSGPIPQDVLANPQAVYEERVSQIDASQSSSRKSAQATFYLTSGYVVSEFMRSGMVLFGDPVTDYLNQIKDYLLREQAELQSKIRVYAVRSTIPNAFATEQGIIFVNMGLLSRLNNEAELAFILCHEIQHYVLQHALKQTFKVQEEKQKAGRNMSNAQLEDLIYNKNKYSRELEMEADNEGMKLFLTSQYGTHSVKDIFTVLRHCDRPAADMPVDLKWFENENFVFAPTVRLDSVTPFAEMTEEEEEKSEKESTHPATTKRELNMKATLADKPDSGILNILGEERFQEVKTRAWFENTQIYVLNHSFMKALYQVQVLQQTYPDNEFLKRKKAECLYGLARYHEESMYKRDFSDPLDVKGEMQRQYYLFWRLKPWEVNQLALAEIWKMHRENPEDPEYRRMCVDLMQDMQNSFDSLHLHVKDMAMTAAEKDSVLHPVPDTAAAAVTDAPNNGMKYEKLRGQTSAQTFGGKRTKEHKGPMLHVLAHILKEESFMALMEEAQSGFDAAKSRRLQEASGAEFDPFKLDHAVNWILDGFCLHNKKGLDIPRTIQYRSDFDASVRDAIDASGIDGPVYSMGALGEGEVEDFNDMAVMRDYFGFDTEAEIQMVNVMNQEARSLGGMEPNRYLMLNMAKVERNMDRVWVAAIVAVFTGGYATPFILLYAVQNNWQAWHVILVYDLETDTEAGVAFDKYWAGNNASKIQRKEKKLLKTFQDNK